MRVFLVVFAILCSICSIQSSTFFDIQDTLTVLCSQFPLISAINDSSLQCARLRTDATIPSLNFNLSNPSQILLFILLDVSSSDVTPININFTLPFDASPVVEEIRVALQVTHASFTINDQTASIYSTYDIPILHWNKSQSNVYEVVSVIHLDASEYETDRSFCQWDQSRWNELFNGYPLSQSAYVYFLTTTNTDLAFIISDKTNLPVPSLYLNVLYCIPYRMGTIEIILIVCLVVLFALLVGGVCLLQYLKDENNFRRYLQRRRDRKQINSSIDTVDSTLTAEDDNTERK